MLHVGTNNLDGHCRDAVFAISRLLIAIRDKCPNVKVVWSNILPRPAPTYWNNRETIRSNIIRINNTMKQRQRCLGFVSCPSHTSFHKSRFPLTRLFARDYLHLKPKGTFLLRELFRQHLLRLRRNWDMAILPVHMLPNIETVIDFNWRSKLRNNIWSSRQ